MRRILFALLLAVFAGCANQPQQPSKLQPRELLGDFKPGTQAADEGIVIVSLSTIGQGIAAQVYGLTRVGEGGGYGALTAYSPKSPRDFQLTDATNSRNGGGRLLVVALPAGTYSFNGFLVSMQGRTYNTSTQYRPTFSVTPGSIVYLGNLHTTISYSTQRNGFVYVMTSRDTRDRDFKLLRERYPHIDGGHVAVALLPANDVRTPVAASKAVSDSTPTNADVKGPTKR
jgi:hypothetical protein